MAATLPPALSYGHLCSKYRALFVLLALAAQNEKLSIIYICKPIVA